MKSPDLHAALLASARRSFSRRGYHAVTVDDVAAGAGLTKGAVYSRFASKLDILLELVDAWGATTARGIARRSVDPYDALMYLLRPAAGGWSLLREFWRLAADEPAVRGRLRSQEAAIEDALARALATWRGERQGRIGASRAMDLHAGLLASAALGREVAIEREDLVSQLFAEHPRPRRARTSA